MKKIIDIMSKTGKWLLVLGIVFSQLSFPLSVLADENSTNDTVITINGEETTNYEISEKTEVKVVLENQGTIIEEKTFNFSNKLYGTYQYTFTSVNKTITINYPGNNAELLSQYVNVTNDLSKTLTYNEKDCIISGFGKELLTVADITTNYYNIATFENYYSAEVKITNGEKILSATDTIINGYQLQIKNNQTELTLIDSEPSTYKINRVGDVDSNGVIDTSDQETILNDILQSNELTNINDTNLDTKLNILDVTNSIFTGNDVSSVTPEKLTPSLTIDKSEILIGEEVEVNLFLSGFDKLSLIGIEGILEYNSDILELVSAKVDESTYSLGYLNNDKFAYILTGFNNPNSAIITFKFKTLTTGTSDITIRNIIGSYGEAFKLENENVTTSVTVLNPEDSKGGDVEENTTSETEFITTPTTVQNVVKPVILSSDYYIKNLIIKGYDIDFDTNTYEYSIKVGNDVDSLDIEVLLNSNKSIYYIEGNEKFKVGENIVSLVVKAENGSTKTYTIKVEKEEKVKKVTEIEEESEEKNTSKTIIIILIILVIIGLIYVIFKDDEEDEKEIKKNNQQEKTKAPKKETKQNNNNKSSNKTKNK